MSELCARGGVAGGVRGCVPAFLLTMCTSLLQVLVYHAAHVFGFQDKIPPTVFRELDQEWFAEACNHTLVS